MLKTIKKAALSALKTAGVTRRIHDSRWRRRRLAILAYHGVSLSDEHRWSGGQFMDADVFRSRLATLRELGCRVLPLGEALARLEADDLPERAVAITFDDGTSDFARKAFPVLREFGFPVTLYLTTFYTEYGRPVFDLMFSYLLWKGRGRTLDLRPLTGDDARIDLAEEPARAAARARIFAFSRERKLKADAKDAFAAALAAQLGIDYAELLAGRVMHNLTPDEVRRLSDAGVDVQLHTHRHRVPVDRALFLRELEDNRASIRRMTGKTASHFCYPSGVTNPAFLPWLKEAGVVSATTCVPGLAERGGDPLMLPRLLEVADLSALEFEGLLTGVSLVLPRR
jgi:peptidoglycan/xylan/chitin deacetylase (PgdA/CDA1 family)